MKPKPQAKKEGKRVYVVLFIFVAVLALIVYSNAASNSVTNRCENLDIYSTVPHADLYQYPDHAELMPVGGPNQYINGTIDLNPINNYKSFKDTHDALAGHFPTTQIYYGRIFALNKPSAYLLFFAEVNPMNGSGSVSYYMCEVQS